MEDVKWLLRKCGLLNFTAVDFRDSWGNLLGENA